MFNLRVHSLPLGLTINIMYQTNMKNNHNYYPQCGNVKTLVILFILIIGVQLTITYFSATVTKRLNFHFNIIETSTHKEPIKHLTKYLYVPSEWPLGNEMWRFASSYGIAASNNITPIVSGKNSLQKFVNLNVQIVSDELLRRAQLPDYVKCKYGTVYSFCPNYMHFDTNMNNKQLIYKFNDLYLQSWKYFKHVDAQIRDRFVFKEPIRRKALAIINTAGKTTGKAISVGVHVRLGDVTAKRLYIQGYRPSPPQYFAKAMHYYRQKYNDVFFIICSTNMTWVNRNINMSDDVILCPSDNRPYDDMAILSNCKHSIMSLGTFGWWSGYLAGGDVIYYGGHPGYGTPMHKQFYHEDGSQDYYPPHWINMTIN